jgi:selenocysteine lyase/cysteine desulfurase
MSLASRGVEVRQVPLDGERVSVARIAEACDDRTRVVSASWVGYASGFRIDPEKLARVAHDHGALFFLDAIQGMGVFPLDVRQADVDFLAADGHKWMLGPEGAGIFYLKREHLDLLRPINVGWNSVKQGNDYSQISLQIRETASRYEGGSQNMAGFIGLRASLELLTEFGLGPGSSPIGEQVVEITDVLCEGLQECGCRIHSPRGAGVSSGIVLFEVPGKDPKWLRQRLMDDGVVTSFRGGHVRASLHCYNDENDIDRLVESIRKHC